MKALALIALALALEGGFLLTLAAGPGAAAPAAEASRASPLAVASSTSFSGPVAGFR
ncbi:MAG TPA: hypothetical protein VFR85_04245 [Anaeromyxobacteraceae bacterium]|nr:hypothetical protein [Anaeromyxobacteraceae bacterium]